MSVCERQFRIEGATLAARHWRADAGNPVLAIHGWLDNAASFDALAAALPQTELIAPDLPGHGLSDHRPPLGSYNLWDDLPVLLGLVDALGWSRFDLLGHSRGAMVSLLLAACLPERVRSVVFLDALTPAPTPPEQVAQQLRRYLEDRLRLGGRRPHAGYESVAAAAATRCRATGMALDTALRLLPRNLEQRAGRYYWRTDPRLSGASAVKLGEEQNRALLEALDMPGLLLLAQGGLAATADWERQLATHTTLRCERLPGGHHFHIEEAPVVAARIQAFWRP